MKNFILAVVFFLASIGCEAQSNDAAELQEDSLSNSEPQTKIIVNKEYDENGNLVSFDSSYSYFYSNVQQDSLFGDSTFSIFREDFFNSFSGIQEPFLNDMFFEDSLLEYDFYKGDFFSKRYKLNRQRFDRLFEEIDSLKNEFYKDFKPPKEGK